MNTLRIRPYLNVRTLLVIALYAVLCAASFYGAYLLRFDFAIPRDHLFDLHFILPWLVVFKLIFLVLFGQVNCVLAYFRLPDAMRLFLALLSPAIILTYLWYAYGGSGLPPRGVILTDLQLSFFSIAAFRVLMRVRASRNLADWLVPTDADGVLVIGAGEVGASLCAELLHKPSYGMRPVAFLDDNPKKLGRFIHGVPVVASIADLQQVLDRYKPSKCVIAIPSASVKRISEVAQLARECGLPVETVPAMTDLVSGRARATQLRPIELEDLLGRDPVDLDSDDIRAMLEGRRVLVTGAGGSIGSELSRQIAGYGPSGLLLIDQSEAPVFNLLQTLPEWAGETVPLTEVADVGDEKRMRAIFERFRPDIIFHAAAHKHVNLMEHHPSEALRNNLFATSRLANLASEQGVDRFILVSTDKAINPTSVMGASKRLAELAILARQQAAGNETRFMAVRFGNVLGSSGSVVPVFKRQIAEGGPLTVTDPDVTRFFMTVSEAAGLVLQSATLGKGGEIFVLDMGSSIRILDIAEQMIFLSGLRPNEDIEIVFTGLRPGEKLHEEVRHQGEHLHATGHNAVLRFVAGPDGPRLTEDAMTDFASALDSDSPAELKARMRSHLSEYTPSVD